MEAFTEKQNFLKGWWMIMVPGLLLAFFVPLAIGLKDTGDITQLLTSAGVFVAVIGLFAFLTLSSRIDETGLTMKFTFQLKPLFISWNDVKRVELGKYNPVFEYGGWGYRRGLLRKKMAYNVAGRTGLKITLSDDRIVLLGTQESSGMHQYLQYIKDKYHIAALTDLQ